MISLKLYFWRLLISIDQLGNAILAGNPDETISSRMGRNLSTCRVCRFVCKLLNLLDKDHCKESIGS